MQAAAALAALSVAEPSSASRLLTHQLDSLGAAAAHLASVVSETKRCAAELCYPVVIMFQVMPGELHMRLKMRLIHHRCCWSFIAL
jgi:hypothetical protein